MGGAALIAALALALGSIAWHAGTAVAALVQPRKRRRVCWPERLPAISILVPVRSPAPALELACSSLARLDYPCFEVVLCAAQDDGDAVAAIRTWTEKDDRFRACLTTVAQASSKETLLAAGADSARHGLLLLSDDNVLSSQTRLQALLAYRQAGYGLVSSGVLGGHGANFWAAVDGAFMNGQFGRLQAAGDAIGLSHATGKSMLVSRFDFQRALPLPHGETSLCEDAELQRRLESMGVRATLCHERLVQPLGRRSAGDVWHRHVRWATCRRRHAPLMFAWELAGSSPVAALAGAMAGLELGLGAITGLWVLAALLAIDWAFAAALGCRPGVRHAAAWTMREVLTIPIWLAALPRQRRVVWRQRVFHASS